MTSGPLNNRTIPVLAPQPPEFAQSLDQLRPFGPTISVTPTGMPQQTGFLQPVPQSNSLRPQPTGFNPFRQSILLPQNTGIQAFGGSLSPTNPFPRPASSMGLSAFGGERVGSPSTSSTAFFGAANQDLMSALPPAVGSGISRPASTPIRSSTQPVSTTHPLNSHHTASR